MLISPAFAQGAGSGGGAGFDPAFIIPWVLILVVMYFLMIRPQQKKVKAHQAMVAALRRGDRVVTAGGIIGAVTRVVSDTELQIEIAEGVRVRVLRGTISEVLSKPAPAGVEDAEDEDEEGSAGDKKGRGRQAGGRGR